MPTRSRAPSTCASSSSSLRSWCGSSAARRPRCSCVRSGCATPCSRQRPGGRRRSRTRSTVGPRLPRPGRNIPVPDNGVPDTRTTNALRVVLGVLVVSATSVGAWAAFAPRSFYEKFPGLGQVWVAVDGPYNEHLVRDVGSLNLALAVVTLCALVTLARATIVASALAWLAYGVPHFVYHARHLGPF